MHTDSCYTLNHKVQATISTVGPYGHALYKHYNNDIISAFLKMDAGGGPETVLPLGVALCHEAQQMEVPYFISLWSFYNFAFQKFVGC